MHKLWWLPFSWIPRLSSVCKSKRNKRIKSPKENNMLIEASKQINLIKNMEHQTEESPVIEKANEDQIINKVMEKVNNQSKQNKEQIVDEIVEQMHTRNKQNEELIIDKIVEQVQTRSKENEVKTIEKISDNILVKTKEYQNELVDDIIRKSEHHCKCEFSPSLLYTV